MSILKQALIKEFEVARNHTWLKKNVKNVSEDIEVLSDECSKHRYCRFSRSKEDFSCSLNQNFDSISVAIQPDEEKEEIAMEGISVDCKEEFKESDKNQVLPASMLSR